MRRIQTCDQLSKSQLFVNSNKKRKRNVATSVVEAVFRLRPYFLFLDIGSSSFLRPISFFYLSTQLTNIESNNCHFFEYRDMATSTSTTSTSVSTSTSAARSSNSSTKTTTATSTTTSATTTATSTSTSTSASALHSWWCHLASKIENVECGEFQSPRICSFRDGWKYRKNTWEENLANW